MYESFPGGGHNNHQSTSQWTGGPAQEAEPSMSLVIAKPDSIKNDTPSEASGFFTPPEIMLYADGFSNSQASLFSRTPSVPQEMSRSLIT